MALRAAMVLAGLIGCSTGRAANTAAQTATSHAMSVDLDSLVRANFAALDRSDAPGGSVAIVRDGRLAYAKSFGLADVENEVPATPTTNYRLASVTKQFTAMAILMLVHDGKLGLDTPLTEIFPDFPPYGRAITVRHLLTHTSGLWAYEDIMPDGPPDDQISDAAVLALMRGRDSTYFPPGSQYRYSNSGYVVLGEIVARRSGLPFPRFLHDRIFVPLGMTGTVAYQRGTSTVAQRAYGHSPRNGAFVRTDQSRTSATLGDGGIYSSVTDLAKWDAALTADRLIPHALLEQAFTPNRLTSGAATEYGFGWFIDQFAGTRRLRHDGTTIGFRNAIERYPDRGLTIIVLTNRNDAKPFIYADSLAVALLR
jgi:CubicO group peptidase (beta-lactamase class C family)